MGFWLSWDVEDHVKMKIDNASAVHKESRGSKRKLEEEEAEVKKCSRVYVVHRQSIFNISMCKLNRFRQAPDPSLRRSVLICNTLRTIEREMVGEGLCPSSPVTLVAAHSDKSILDPPPSPSDAFFHGAEADEERSSTPFPAGFPVGPGPAAGRWELVEPISWSSVLSLPSAPEEGEADEGGPSTSPSSSSDSGISTASDEIFGDIDLSLYDFDLVPLSPPNPRAAPPTAEELLRSFPPPPGKGPSTGHDVSPGSGLDQLAK